MLTTEQLDAIRTRASAATPGPWVTDGPEIFTDLREWIGECMHTGGAEAEAVGERDAKFIAHAREDVPALLADLDRITDERDEALAELKTTQNARLLSVIFGHHKGAPKPFALQRRNGHALVALGAEFPDGAVALRLVNDGGWTTKSDGGAELFCDDGTEIVWLSDELELLAEMEQQRDHAVTQLAGAKALIGELQAGQRYQEALGRGLSDYEAREEGWPVTHAATGSGDWNRTSDL